MSGTNLPPNIVTATPDTPALLHAPGHPQRQRRRHIPHDRHRLTNRPPTPNSFRFRHHRRGPKTRSRPRPQPQPPRQHLTRNIPRSPNRRRTHQRSRRHPSSSSSPIHHRPIRQRHPHHQPRITHNRHGSHIPPPPGQHETPTYLPTRRSHIQRWGPLAHARGARGSTKAPPPPGACRRAPQRMADPPIGA